MFKFKILQLLLLTAISVNSWAQLSSLMLDMPDNNNYQVLLSKERSYLDSLERNLNPSDSLVFFSGCGEYKALKNFMSNGIQGCFTMALSRNILILCTLFTPNPLKIMISSLKKIGKS
jgi:hypothetical protein